jgi:cytochrome c biogenesis protein CcmG/thiol:disulfide interchange protein DsbE
MRRSLARLAAVGAAAALAAGCSAGGLGSGATRPVASTAARAPAPPVSVAALDGDGRITLAAHRGAPVVLNFWASWCGPCERETPALIAFSKANTALDVVGIAVNDDPADSRRFARRFAIPYELGSDRAGDSALDFGATGLPVTVVIDDQGRVADTFFGEITRAQLDGYAEQLGL